MCVADHREHQSAPTKERPLVQNTMKGSGEFEINNVNWYSRVEHFKPAGSKRVGGK